MGNAYAKEDQGDLNVFNISTSRSSNYKDIDLTSKRKEQVVIYLKRECAQ